MNSIKPPINEKVTQGNAYLQPERDRWARYVVFYRRHAALLFLLVLAGLFIGLAAIVHAGDVQAFDVRLSLFIQRWHSPLLDRLMLGATLAGSIGTVIAITVAASLFFVRLKKYKSSLLIILSLLSYPLNVLIKDLVERNRPHSALIRVLSPNSGFSFPSGHAMISITIYGLVAYLLWVYLEAANWRRLVLIVTGVLILLIGVSRVYLGAHWATDVTGGWIAGLILLIGLVEIHNRITTPPLPPASP